MRKGILTAVAAALAFCHMPVYAGSETYFNNSFFDGTAWIEAEENIYLSNGASVEESIGSNTYITLNGDTFDDADKPYLSYKIFAEKQGEYSLEFVSSTVPESIVSDWQNWSPFSISINDETPIAINGTLLIAWATTGAENLFGTRYIAVNGVYSYAKYRIPVHLNAGENILTFTVEGKKDIDEGYHFSLDGFSLNYLRDNSDCIFVSANEAFAGNGYMNTVSDANAEGGAYNQLYRSDLSAAIYADYMVYSDHDGEFRLDFSGSHPRRYLSGWSLDINRTQKILTGNDTDGDGYDDAYSNEVTAVCEYVNDVDYVGYMANRTAHLKKGVNIVRLAAESPRTDGKNTGYLFNFDCMKFTPVSAPEAEAESIGTKTQYEHIDSAASGVSGGKYTAVVIPVSKDEDGKVIGLKGKSELSYSVIIPRDDSYELEMDMSGYVEATDAHMYRAPVKLRVDDGEEIRLVCGGSYYNMEGDQQKMDATISKIMQLSLSGGAYGGNFEGYFARYRLNEPLQMDAGVHTITFIIDEIARNNSNALFALDKFSLVPTGEGVPDTAVAAAENSAVICGGRTQLSLKVFDPEGIMVDNDDLNIVYSSDKPAVASVDENGIVTGKNAGSAVITVRAEGYGESAESKCNIYVFNGQCPIIVTGVTAEDNNTIISCVNGNKVSIVPTFIAVRYNITNGEDSSFVDVKTKSVDVKTPGVTADHTLAADNTADRTVVYVWDNTEDMHSYYEKVYAK